jgi:hypothetical protein
MHYVPAPDYRVCRADQAKMPVLQLFRLGLDTVQIAELKGMPEPKVYNFLHSAREKERRGASGG